ncbi:AraC family transcriptional regulator [Alsobacter sp. KACC 23698]|uniref:AraC family transcriptional regulator n=1 Tax=Alsobacter sp. KACC 23698 TaxID=3149229 RepID=A0AAU7JM71_9HYPH
MVSEPPDNGRETPADSEAEDRGGSTLTGRNHGPSGDRGGNHVPDLEVVDVPREASFKVWAHGYPFRTVRWHFHPEYEIHLVTETSGRSFIGDFIGTFRPGNLVMTGPNLPHNWISDVPRGEVIARRGIVLQFTQAFIANCMAVAPELRALGPLLERSEAGFEFEDGVGEKARFLLERILDEDGVGRLGLFFQLMALLQQSGGRQLASAEFRARPEVYASDPLNHVLEHIARNLGEDLTQTDLAELSGFTPTAFSRAFQRHTGLTFVRYVNQLRVNRACELLRVSKSSIADVCFLVGFNNLSNFNRQFLALKGVAPSVYRREYRINITTGDRDSPSREPSRTLRLSDWASGPSATRG